jgi:hypothetical protein
VFLQVTDEQLNNMPFTVDAPVYKPWLGGELRDDGGDAAAPEVLAGRPAGVAAVGRESSRSVVRAARAGSLGGRSRHQRLERSLLVALAGDEDEGDGSSALLAEQVELAAKTAPRATERLAFLPRLAPAV